MTYEKKTDSLLSGGLNLAPPGDLVGDSQAITFDNFRPYSDGSIRSRLGQGAALASPGSSITSISKVETMDATWFVGAGGTITPVNGGGSSVTGFGADAPISMASMDGMLWATTQQKQVRYDGTSPKPWIPDAPTSFTLEPVAGGGPLVIGKVYTYYVTFVNGDGYESDSAPSQDFIPDNPNQTVRVHLPTSSDPDVTGCNIYRTGNTLNDAYLLNPTPAPLGFVYEDGGGDSDTLKQSDESLLRLGIAFESDHQGPPPAAGVAGPYFGKLLMWNSAEHPNRLWWSRTGKPYAFPGSNLDVGNWVDMGDEGEKILDVSLFPNMAVVYKANSIWRLVGDPDDAQSSAEWVSSGVSMVGPKARTRAGHVDLIMGGEGVYSVNGDTAVKVSPQLDPIFRGEQADTPYAIQPLSTDRSMACLAHRYGRVYVSYPEAPSTSNNRTIVYDMARKTWASDTRGFSAMFDEGPVGSLLAANATLFDIEDGGSDNGTAIHCLYQSGYKNQGAPENPKTYADVTIEANTGGASYGVSLNYNNGATSEFIGNLQTSSRQIVSFRVGSDPDKLGTRAFNVAVRLEGDANTSLPTIIYNITLHYYVEARQAKTIDTGWSDFGLPLVKDVDLVEWEMEAAEAVKLNVFVDGGAVMFSTNIGPTVGRQKIETPTILPNTSGRLFRITLTSDTPFMCYGGRVRFRPIGQYFNGANGESFKTQDIAIGL